MRAFSSISRETSIPVMRTSRADKAERDAGADADLEHPVARPELQRLQHRPAAGLQHGAEDDVVDPCIAPVGRLDGFDMHELADSASNRHSRHADCSHVSTRYEDRTSSTPRGERAAEAVRGYRKGGFLPTEELVRLGHDVTLFASGDSQTAARLVACAQRALRLDPEVIDALPHHLLMIERVRSRVHEFDVLHFHVEHVHLPLFRPYARVTTLHGRLDLPDLVPLYREFHEMPLVSVSNAQRRPLAGRTGSGPCTTVCPTPCPYNPAPRGVPRLPRPSPERESSTRSRSRAAPACRCASPPRSIEWTNLLARRVAPLVSDPLIEFVGEVSEEDKPSFLGNASALLFPIDWPEPFGLVMIEAMSCGTPVIAWPRGSVPRSSSRVTGHHELGRRGRRRGRSRRRLDRARVRQRFEERFSATRMALGYLGLYRKLDVKKTELVP